MIKSIHIENYKCFKDFDIEGLGPFNVLVGPNDSGKTALLEAILLATASRRKKRSVSFAALREDLGLNLGPYTFWRNNPEAGFRIALTGEKQEKEPFWEPHVMVQSEGTAHLARFAARYPDGTDRSEGGEGAFEDLLDRIGRAKYYRF
ncbi:MAG TPA: AAA family ATPase, partial [Phycisphaerae bacterium]|nr:AAA family ATPase [Phycisphaerae bacterium]